MDNDQAPRVIGRGGCAKCNSLAADLEATEAQRRLSIVGYEETIREQRGTITELRERIAQLECNRDLRMDRVQGWDTSNLGES